MSEHKQHEVLAPPRVDRVREALQAAVHVCYQVYRREVDDDEHARARLWAAASNGEMALAEPAPDEPTPERLKAWADWLEQNPEACSQMIDTSNRFASPARLLRLVADDMEEKRG